MTAKARLVLLSRAWCHLCDDMRDALNALATAHEFDLEIVDVDNEPELERRYGEDVPVLLGNGRELSRHRLDPARVTAYLGAFSGAAGSNPLE